MSHRWHKCPLCLQHCNSALITSICSLPPPYCVSHLCGCDVRCDVSPRVGRLFQARWFAEAISQRCSTGWPWWRLVMYYIATGPCNIGKRQEMPTLSFKPDALWLCLYWIKHCVHNCVPWGRHNSIIVTLDKTINNLGSSICVVPCTFNSAENKNNMCRSLVYSTFKSQCTQKQFFLLYHPHLSEFPKLSVQYALEKHFKIFKQSILTSLYCVYFCLNY